MWPHQRPMLLLVVEAMFATAQNVAALSANAVLPTFRISNANACCAQPNDTKPFSAAVAQTWLCGSRQLRAGGMICD